MIPCYIRVFNTIHVLQILNDTQRLITICLKNGGPQCSCSIAEQIGIEKTSVSKNLGVMEKAKLVNHKRDGKGKKFSLTTYGQSTYELLKAHDLGFKQMDQKYRQKSLGEYKCRCC